MAFLKSLGKAALGAGMGAIGGTGKMGRLGGAISGAIGAPGKGRGGGGGGGGGGGDRPRPAAQPGGRTDWSARHPRYHVDRLRRGADQRERYPAAASSGRRAASPEGHLPPRDGGGARNGL